MTIKEITDKALPKLLSLPVDKARTVLNNLFQEVYKKGYERGIKDFHMKLSKSHENRT